MTTTDPDAIYADPMTTRQGKAAGWMPLRILLLALPLMAGSLAGAGLQVVKTALLTHHGEEGALYTLSMTQPAFIFMLAFLEAIAITNQVFSSKSVNGWAKGDVLRATAVFTRIGTVLSLIFIAAFAGLAPFSGGLWAEGPVILPQMALFAASMLPYLWFELRNGALRGQGRTGLALLCYLVLIVVDLAVTYVALFQFNLGFTAVLLGNAAGPLVALPVISLLLRREIGNAATGDDAAFRKHIIGLSIGVAGPVFASMFAGSASAAVIFPAMASLGETASSAFLIVVRLRIFFLIPAVAMGSAIAILVNQMPEEGQDGPRRTLLLGGVGMVLGLYALALAALAALQAVIVASVVDPANATLTAAVLTQLRTLLPSFYLIAAFTMLQVILEHLGLGIRALAVTVLSEVATIVCCLLALPNGLSALLFAMNGLAVATFAVLAVLFLLILGRPVAVSATPQNATKGQADAV